MPQMAPMWWWVMFMVFIMTLFIMLTMMYSFKLYTLKSKSTKNQNGAHNINWKW